MKTIAKFGLAALAVGAFLGTALPSNADTPNPSNPFTKHGLPIPGAYFQARENQQVATVAVSKSGQGIGEGKFLVRRRTETPSYAERIPYETITQGALV